MKLYSEGKSYKLYHGDMRELSEVLHPNSIDSIVTDPPYELNFMGKGWDNSGIAFQKGTWEKCYEVLKPGGYLLAFGGTRTFHRIACAIEDAGFEIRDTIMWLYGSGFPKSLDLGDGWGTALKPAYEPVIISRKPCEGTCTDNVLKHGVGGINIDDCRVMVDDTVGRFPSNVIITYDETDEQEVCGGLPQTESNGGATTMPKMGGGDLGVCNYQTIGADRVATDYIAPMDSGSAARYFYCAKASKKDRDEGLGEFVESRKAGYGYDKGYQNAGEGMFKERQTMKRNMHPTVKPTELMQYLVRLVTPKGGTVLDPFNGSGSTGKAVMYENYERQKDYQYIGIELTEQYLPIAQARIEYAQTGVLCGLADSVAKVVKKKTYKTGGLF